MPKRHEDRGTRLDLVSSEGIRSLPGLSFTYTGQPPAQDGVTLDGDDLSPVPQLSPEEAAYASHLLVSLPWLLRPNAQALVLEPRGGLDVLVGLAGGAASIVAVEPHGAIVDLAQRAGSSLVTHPRVEWIVAEPRSYVERTTDGYDVIDLALTAPYRPVTSGAYSLAEDYSLTVEAFVAYLEKLEPDGVLGADDPGEDEVESHGDDPEDDQVGDDLLDGSPRFRSGPPVVRRPRTRIPCACHGGAVSEILR